MQFRKFDTLRCFGIEMEIGREVPRPNIVDFLRRKTHRQIKSSYYHPSINNYFWDVKLDGSCGAKLIKGINEGGYEITSYKGSGVYDLIHISKVISSLKSINVKVNENCGFHVHVDVSDFSSEDVGILINNWLCIEYFIFCMVPDRRKVSKYCTRFTSVCKYNKTCLNASDYWNLYKPNNTSLNNADRRLSMNLVNYYRSITLKSFKRKTVEFRFPESTLVEKNIKNWARFLINFIELVKSRQTIYPINSVDNVCDFLSFSGLRFDDNNLLSEGLLETRNWAIKKLRRHSCNSQIKNEANVLLEVGPK